MQKCSKEQIIDFNSLNLLNRAEKNKSRESNATTALISYFVLPSCRHRHYTLLRASKPLP